MSRGALLTGTPADLIAYQNDLIRRKEFEPLGRMNKITIGPSADWTPPPIGQDPFLDRFGRLIDFRSRFLPIAKSLDDTMLIITAPCVAKSLVTGNFEVGLPDVPDPTGKPAPWTPEEVCGKVERHPDKDRAQMLPQRLEDRAERPNGRLAELEGTHFLVFQPVLWIAFQPEVLGQLQPAVDRIECKYDDATGTNMVLLVDRFTGEAHFYGGRFDIIRTGE